MLEINQTEYYQKLTEALRTPLVSKNLICCREGYLYKSDRLGFLLYRASKNRYAVLALRPGGHAEEGFFSNLAAAVEYTIALISLDKEGQI